jgi:hypothetical protein
MIKDNFEFYRAAQRCPDCGRPSSPLVFVRNEELVACLCVDCAMSAVTYFGWTEISEEELEVFLVHNE